MQRREFIKLAAASMVVATPIAAISMRSETVSLQRLRDVLASNDFKTVSSAGNVFAYLHCAQSIELSILGYPNHKSDIFKNSVGNTAFSAFKWFGTMHHDVNEPIPGAQPLPIGLSEQEAKQQLVAVIDKYLNHSGPLAEHFAYGELSKAEYNVAHALHIQDHFPGLAV